jgi:hypothetical protein
MTPRNPTWEIQTITDYKQQNEQYLKIIEKQRAIIKSLQQSVTQLSNENEALVKKNKELEASKPVGLPGFDSTNVTHQTITEITAKKELSYRKEAVAMVTASTLPVPPPRSPYRVNQTSVHPLDCSRNNNQAVVDLPKRPPVLKLAVSNHALLQSRSAKDTADIVSQDYLNSPNKQIPSNPSSPHSSISSTNDRPSFDSDHSSTSSTKYSAQASIPSPARSETIGHAVDTVTAIKSKSEPSTPVKPRTPRYDSLMTQSSSDKSMLETAILSNLSSISVKVLHSSLEIDEKGKDTYVYTIGIIQKSDSSEIWRIQKTLQDLLVLDAKVRYNFTTLEL